MKKAMTPERIRELLDYDPETGVLTNRTTRSDKAIAGARAGSRHGEGYIEMQLEGHKLLAHRVAWAHFYGEWPTGKIDHKNGVRDDNSIANLRDISHRANIQNRQRAQKNNLSTGLLGVHWREDLYRYVARIKVNGKHMNLGVFECRFAAYRAYRDAKRKYHEGNTL